MRGVRGTINVFVALMMVPTLAFTGALVDFARLRMASVQINNAADLAASSVLAYYDGLLEDVYGLYAVSQNKSEYDKFSKQYAHEALGLDANGKKKYDVLSLFSAGEAQEFNSVIDTSSQYSLRNAAYFQSEVAQYMKYRAAFSLLEVFGIMMDVGDAFEKSGGNNQERVLNDKDFIDGEYASILEDWQYISDRYPELIAAVEEAEGCESAVNSPIPGFETEATEKFSYIYSNYGDIHSGVIPSSSALAWKAIEEDAEDIEDGRDELEEHLDEYQEKMKAANDIAQDIASKTAALKNKIAAAQNELLNSDKYSSAFVGDTGANPPDSKKGMYAQLKEISDALIDGVGTAGSGFKNANDAEFDSIRDDLDDIKYGTYSLRDVISNAAAQGTEGTLIIDSQPTVENIHRLRITEFDRDILAKIKELANQEPPRTEAEIEAENADREKEAEDIEKQVRDGAGDTPSDREVKAKTIPSGLIERWKDEGIDGSTDDNPGEELINRALMVEYGMQMFTNYTTNKRQIAGGKKYEDGKEKMLSNILFNPDLNYLYRSELEYVLIGDDNAGTNVNRVITMLSAYFSVQNWLYTFRDNEIKAYLSAIRYIPYVGAALAEVARVTISGIETWLDIKDLLDGKKVPFIKAANKSPKEWRTSGQGAFNNIWNTGDKIGEGMYYHEYLRMMILFDFTAENNQIAHRLTNLIELNLNHYKNAIDKLKDDGGSNAAFKADRAYVIVDAKLTGTVPYFFLPMNFFDNSGLSEEDRTKRKYEVVRTRGY